MQETRNNCFGSKKCSTTFRQAKTGKHEYRNVTATYIFSTRNICFEFLASYGVILQNDIQPSIKLNVYFFLKQFVHFEIQLENFT